MTNDDTNLEVDSSALHEAAHAVAAFENAMTFISLRLKPSISTRKIPTNADISYSWFVHEGESCSNVLERRLIVALAGPAWEKFSLGTSVTCRTVLNREKDDRIAAVSLIRELYRHGVRGNERKACVQGAWKAAQDLVSRRNAAIITVAYQLEIEGELDDSQVRLLLSEEVGTAETQG